MKLDKMQFYCQGESRLLETKLTSKHPGGNLVKLARPNLLAFKESQQNLISGRNQLWYRGGKTD